MALEVTSGPKPYYSDSFVSIYLGDAREWMPEADVLVTDPPYGRGWKQGALLGRSGSLAHAGIAGDEGTGVRDAVLEMWGDRPAVVFGDLMLPPPVGTRQVLVYHKPPNAGLRGAMGGWRRDVEAIYLLGEWTSGLGGMSSIIATRTRSQGNPYSPQGKYNHPHAKPIDVMIALIEHTVGVVLDPFVGSGSTLVAAKSLGRRAIGIEIEERYAAMAAQRCSQEALGL